MAPRDSRSPAMGELPPLAARRLPREFGAARQTGGEDSPARKANETAMKTWVLLAPGQLELREVPDPEPGPQEAVVRVRAAGVCGSDVECYAGRHPLPNYPRVPGHELAGEVAAIGSSWQGPPAGARVAVDPALSCGSCYACRHGRHNCCANISIAGVHRPGAMAEYIVCQASQLHIIPEEMGFETAAVVETLSIGAQAVRRGQVVSGDLVVVLGAGPIGLCCLMMAKQEGAKVLVAEPLAWRRAAAAELGADACVDPQGESLPEAVQSFTDGYGAHVVIDASGDLAAAQASLSLVGAAGRVVILTISPAPMEVAPWELVQRELTVLGSRLTLSDFRELIGLVRAGAMPIGRLVTHRFPMGEADQAHRAACQRDEGVIKTIILPQEAGA